MLKECCSCSKLVWLPRCDDSNVCAETLWELGCLGCSGNILHCQANNINTCLCISQTSQFVHRRRFMFVALNAWVLGNTTQWVLGNTTDQIKIHKFSQLWLAMNSRSGFGWCRGPKIFRCAALGLLEKSTQTSTIHCWNLNRRVDPQTCPNTWKVGWYRFHDMCYCVLLQNAPIVT